MTPRVSIVIPAFNRAEGLRRALDSIARTEGAPPFEVIVVDDASTDATPDMTAAFKASSPYPLRLLRLDHNGGPGRARNAGVRAAAGEVVVFTDTDCVVTPQWLRRIIAPLNREQRIGGVGGGVQPLPPVHWAARYHTASGTLDAAPDPNFLITCNACFLREALPPDGGFTDDLRTPGGEDIEASIRAWHNGWRFAYAPDAVVQHEYPPGLRAFARTWRNYGYGCALVLHRLLRREEWDRNPAIDNYWDIGVLQPSVTGPGSLLRDLVRYYRWQRSIVSAREALLHTLIRPVDRIAFARGWREGAARFHAEQARRKGKPAT